MKIEMPGTTACFEDSAVTPAQHDQLVSLLSACFSGPANDMFLKRRYWREPPRYRVVYRDENSLIQGHVAGHDKKIRALSGTFRVLGVSEVAVHPARRGRGTSRRLLGEMEDWGRAQGFQFSVLFGPRELYGPLGYLPADNLFRHSDWPSHSTSVGRIPDAQFKAFGLEAWPEGLVDLLGPTW